MGYLPQDPRAANTDELARDRILDARGLTDIAARSWTYPKERTPGQTARRYERAEASFGTRLPAVGSPAASVGLPSCIWMQSSNPSAANVDVELARILFSGADVRDPQLLARIRFVGCVNSCGLCGRIHRDQS